MATQVMINDPAKAKEYFEAKMAFTTGPVELERMMKNNEVNIVDVRAAEDYAQGHIPGAVNLPKDQWSALKGLRKGQDERALLLFAGLSSRRDRCRAVCRSGLSHYGTGRRVALVEGRWVRCREVSQSLTDSHHLLDDM